MTISDRIAPASPLTPILDEGRSPSEWVKQLAQRGFTISERTLREKANRLGACYKLGRAMIITPEQLDTIVKDRKDGPVNAAPSRAARQARQVEVTKENAIADLQSRRHRGRAKR